MSQELEDFKYFKEHQLFNYDPLTGVLDTYKGERVYLDVGSVNDDGYVRVWANKRLRMKHRLTYFLSYGVLPPEGSELDHIDNIRHHNWISNLRVLTKSKNNSGCANRKFGKQMTKEEVHELCKLLQDTTLSDLSISVEIGRSRGTVRDVKTRRSRTSISKEYSWTHRGF